MMSHWESHRQSKASGIHVCIVKRQPADLSFITGRIVGRHVWVFYFIFLSDKGLMLLLLTEISVIFNAVQRGESALIIQNPYIFIFQKQNYFILSNFKCWIKALCWIRCSLKTDSLLVVMFLLCMRITGSFPDGSLGSHFGSCGSTKILPFSRAVLTRADCITTLPQIDLSYSLSFGF